MKQDIAGAAVASAVNVVSDWLNRKIVSQNEGGLKLADPEVQEISAEVKQKQNSDDPEAQFS